MRSKLILLLFLQSIFCIAQKELQFLDSVHNSLQFLTNDTDIVKSMVLLSDSFSTVHYGSALVYGHKAWRLSEQIKFDAGRIAAFYIFGVCHTRGGNVSKALDFEFTGLQISKEKKITTGEAFCYYTIDKAYYFLIDYANSLKYCSIARQLHLQSLEKFAVECIPDLDADLPKINVVAQDISRVILNIVNNAFQACQEKNLLGLNRGNHDANLVGLPQNQEEYKPVVLLATKFSPNGTGAALRLPTGQAGLCEICISDNGPGIPDAIKEKIFQPFFTTKPTGQGTGLGLSLAYDIIKAHGGEIKVESKNGYGTDFIIIIPITQ